jgi:hypothetical protein
VTAEELADALEQIMRIIGCDCSPLHISIYGLLPAVTVEISHQQTCRLRRLAAAHLN